MKTISKFAKAEITEKRSKFIGHIYYVSSVKEAEEKIKEIRKQNNMARHNCFAYRVFENNIIVEKSSDDGEPAGTAGAPILNLLAKNELANCLVVVTRYFGGILLGTGGLVRAYGATAKLVIDEAGFSIIEPGFEINVTIPYEELNEFKYYCQKNSIILVNTEYKENIQCKIQTNIEEKEKLLNKTIENKFNIQKIEILKEIYIKIT